METPSFPHNLGADNCSSDGTSISLLTSRVSKVLLASESHCESWTKTRLGGVRAAAKAGDALDQVLTSFRLCPRPSHSSSERSSDWIDAATDFDFGHGSCSGDLDFDKRHSARIVLRGQDVQQENTAPHFAPPLPGLDVAHRAAYSLVNLLRCLRVCKYTRRIRMRVLATHIKHAMSGKIEWAALPALVYLCTRAPPIVRLRLPAHPPWPPLAPVSCPSCKLSPVVGDRVLRATGRCAKQKRVGEFLRRLPSALASPRRERRSTSKSHSPALCFSAPFQFYGFSSLVGYASSPAVMEARLSSRFVSILSFRPLFLSASGPATRSASPSIYGIDFLCYFSEMAGTRPQPLRGVDNAHSCTRGRGG
ncbi:hypothetical protein B0H13DRAFT_2687390 [Mycena leptocephala]|nr:hypothetical protein B0H13DRAFT_2687390 [Mycena leptocephala]